MYAKVYNLKFPSVAEAKIAASFCADCFGPLIVDFNMRSLNIALGACGSMTVQTKFDDSETLKKFEAKAQDTFEELKQSMAYKETHYSGVYIYHFEAEAASAELGLNAS